MVYFEKKVWNPIEITYSSCGSTLISKDYVITAAHCIETANASDITLFAGLDNSQSSREFGRRQQRTVREIHIHPQYNSISLINDIAVLRVNTFFIFNKYVQPACLPGPEPQFNDEVIIIGWGAETPGGANSKTLKQASTDVVDGCDLWIPQVDRSKQICVADAFDGSSICGGDSGGPLLNQYQGQYIVSGIASFVIAGECDTKDSQSTPNVFTRVAAYKDWIKNITG